MVSEAFQNEVGVRRLLSLLRLSPGGCSAQGVLLQLAAVAPGSETPLYMHICPRGSFLKLAFGVLASLHGVIRRVARSWRSPSWHLRRGLLPVALAALSLVNLSSPFKRQHDHDQIRLSPCHGSSCSSSLLVFVFSPPRDSSWSPLL